MKEESMDKYDLLQLPFKSSFPWAISKYESWESCLLCKCIFWFVWAYEHISYHFPSPRQPRPFSLSTGFWIFAEIFLPLHFPCAEVVFALLASEKIKSNEFVQHTVRDNHRTKSRSLVKCEYNCFDADWLRISVLLDMKKSINSFAGQKFVWDFHVAVKKSIFRAFFTLSTWQWNVLMRRADWPPLHSHS